MTATKVLIICIILGFVVSVCITLKERNENLWDIETTIVFFVLYRVSFTAILYFGTALIKCIAEGKRLSVYFPNPWI